MGRAQASCLQCPCRDLFLRTSRKALKSLRQNPAMCTVTQPAPREPEKVTEPWVLRGACCEHQNASPSGTRSTLAETALAVVIWELGTGHVASPARTRPEAALLGTDPEGVRPKGCLCQVRGWATSEIRDFYSSMILLQRGNLVGNQVKAGALAGVGVRVWTLISSTPPRSPPSCLEP